MKTAVTSREVSTTVGGGAIQYPVTVPEGTLCKMVGNRWVVQSLGWLPKNSGAYHDAYYRGITINEADLEDIK